MEKQIGLNELTRQKLAQRIAKGQEKATNAIDQLIQDGRFARDFIAPLGVNLKSTDKKPQITFFESPEENKVLMHVGENPFYLHENAVNQIAEKLGVPQKYLRQLATGTEWERRLAVKIMNDHSEWTERNRVLIRAVKDEVRGVLSDQYRRLNSQEIAEAFLKEVTEQGAVLADGFCDSTRMYCEVLLPEPYDFDTPKNGLVTIAFGARLSTSDFGDGALELRSFLMQGVCLNGMVRESAMRQIHLGKKLPDNLSLSERTYRLDTQTTSSAIRDLSKNLLSKDMIIQKAQEIQEASGMEIDMNRELSNLIKVGVRKDEVTEISNVLMRNDPNDGVSGESTLWKLTQGITAHARKLNPRRERELQEIAGQLMERIK